MNVLRRVFGPSRREIWEQLSAEMHGRYVQGTWFTGDKVQVTHGAWTLTLDTYVISTGKSAVIFTRMRAPYVNPDGFRFTIYRSGVFSDIAKRLGMQDVEIGTEPFDTDFIIKGTDEVKLRALLSSPRIKELIAAQPQIHLTVQDDEGWFGEHVPEGVDELYFQVVGVIKDTERLKALYDLFSETLDQLCRIGSAYEQAPDVKV